MHDNKILSTRRAMIAGIAAAMGSAATAAPVIRFSLKPVAAPPAPTVAPLGWQRVFLSPGTSTADDWRQLIGALFTVAGETGSSTLKLVEVRPLPASGTRPAGTRAQAFALVFEVTPLQQAPRGNRSYRLTHAQYGGVDLLLGATSFTPGKATLIAILN
jgi:hypothetical protein